MRDLPKYIKSHFFFLGSWLLLCQFSTKNIIGHKVGYFSNFNTPYFASWITLSKVWDIPQLLSEEIFVENWHIRTRGISRRVLPLTLPHSCELGLFYSINVGVIQSVQPFIIKTVCVHFLSPKHVYKTSMSLVYGIGVLFSELLSYIKAVFWVGVYPFVEKPWWTNFADHFHILLFQ